VQGSLGACHVCSGARRAWDSRPYYAQVSLRLHWSWLARTDPSRSLFALPAREEQLVRAMFVASTTVHVGDGRSTVRARTQATRLVHDALHNDLWIRDIEGALSMAALEQYVELWHRLQSFHLVDDTPDRFF
jgi:hypothetical protein